MNVQIAQWVKLNALGYVRFDGAEMARVMARLYAAARL